MNSQSVPDKLEFIIDLPWDKSDQLVSMVKDWGHTLRLTNADYGLSPRLELGFSTLGARDVVVVERAPTTDGKESLKVLRQSPHPVGDEFILLLQREIPKAIAALSGIERGAVAIPRIKVGMGIKQVIQLLGYPAETIGQPGDSTWIYNHPAGQYSLVVKRDVVVRIDKHP